MSKNPAEQNVVADGDFGTHRKSLMIFPILPYLLSHYGSIHSGPLLNTDSAGPVTAGFPWMSKKDAQEEVKEDVDESGETVSLLNGKQRRFLIAHGISNARNIFHLRL